MTGKDDYQHQAKILAALADPTRLQILELLAGCVELSSTVISEKLEISLSLTCHHTKLLAESGLIEKRKEGQTSYNRLNRDVLNCSMQRLLQLAAQTPLKNQ
jgi:DNA-binding transcriptional ArsR family regulator